jgi:hypothetical protein
MHANEMKRLLRIFELTENEQRVVLIVILTLVAISFVSYERRTHCSAVQPISTTKGKSSPTPVETEHDQ